jgi:hypothetical protein
MWGQYGSRIKMGLRNMCSARSPCDPVSRPRMLTDILSDKGSFPALGETRAEFS